MGVHWNWQKFSVLVFTETFACTSGGAAGAPAAGYAGPRPGFVVSSRYVRCARGRPQVHTSAECKSLKWSRLKCHPLTCTLSKVQLVFEVQRFEVQSFAVKIREMKSVEAQLFDVSSFEVKCFEM